MNRIDGVVRWAVEGVDDRLVISGAEPSKSNVLTILVPSGVVAWTCTHSLDANPPELEQDERSVFVVRNAVTSSRPAVSKKSSNNSSL